MFFISDVFGLIPDSFKQSAVDAIVETVVERGEGLLSDSILNRIKGLRSDAAFRKQLDVGMQRGLQRFADEYQLKDEDLVAAILQDTALFTAHAVRDALIEIVQQPGRYLMEERTLVSQTFAAVLPGRINRERVDRAILYLLKCLAQEMWHLPELQPIYSLEFQRITAEVAHEQLAVQKAQLAALESMNSGVRDAFLQLTEALSEQKRLSVAPETASLSTPRPTIYHNLPRPDYGEFIGREEELNQIFSLLRPSPLSNYHLIVVDGVGGIGKSTLALEVAYRCLQTSLQALEGQKETEQDHLAQMRQILIERFNEEELCDLCFDMALDYEMLPGKGKGSKTRELITYLQRRNRLVELIETVQRLRPDIEYYNWFPNTQDSTVVAEKFDAIIWTSAKQSVLTADGIVARRQVLHTLDEIYTAIAIALQRDDILRTSGHYRDQLVRRALVQQRTLLVIDNFETIDDKSVITFLRELPGTTKAIVTTRYRLDASYPIRLQGMPWRKAKELIKNEAAARNLYLTDKEMRLLFELTGGVPLAIVWSMGQIGYGYIVSSVLKKLSSPNNEIVQYCFENSIEQIKTKPAYQLLLALSLFVTSASRQMLGKITQLSESDRDEGLVQLERLSLVNKSITQDDEDNQSAKLSEPGNQSGSQSRFSLLPLTTNYARARLIDEPTKEKLFHYRWIEDILEFIDLQRKKGYSTLDSVRLEVDNTLAAIDWCWDEDES
ncbi:MAG: ATP-binding protein, partial [Ardenticatenaceae bacterium]|nr:ATP-binding protein [Ardenticatenaceae bacterium]